MQAMCRRALKIGLPALAFTEHLDITGWVIDPEDLLFTLPLDQLVEDRKLDGSRRLRPARNGRW
jgi:hypothetical protein